MSPSNADRVPAASGIAVIDKPPGLTSHQVVGRIRRIAGTRKVGHAGTLDPMATGVLVVGIEKATRLLGYLAGGDKTYQATIRLGQATVTDDAEGEIVAAAGAAGATEADVLAALPRFTGPIRQRPSAVSAIKVDGVRSYANVRAGKEVELPERPVTVHAYDLLATRTAEVDGLAVLDCDVVVSCSSGTYIRALARDLGTLLGTGGHLTVLRRTTVGPFGLDVAQTLDEAAADLRVSDLSAVATATFPSVALTRAEAVDVGFGRALPEVTVPADPTAVLDPDGTFLALYQPENRPDRTGSRPVSVFVG